MTYVASEESIESGKPIELFTVVFGTNTYRWTSSEDEQVVGGLTYTAEALKRTDISQGANERDATLQIDIPGNNEFAKQWIASAPSIRSTLTIQRLHRDDFPSPEVITIFQGFVKAVNWDKEGGRIATLAVEPLIAALSRSIPQFTYQGLCNNVLYDELCGVDETDTAFSVTLNVTAVSGNSVTVPGLAAFGDGWFTGGFAEAQGGTDARLIVDQTGDILTLHIPFVTNPLGSALEVFAGCSHAISLCGSKFNNVGRFGGFGFGPTINIFETGLDPALCN